jgi:hypothetical protein
MNGPIHALSRTLVPVLFCVLLVAGCSGGGVGTESKVIDSSDPSLPIAFPSTYQFAVGKNKDTELIARFIAMPSGQHWAEIFYQSGEAYVMLPLPVYFRRLDDDWYALSIDTLDSDNQAHFVAELDTTIKSVVDVARVDRSDLEAAATRHGLAMSGTDLTGDIPVQALLAFLVEVKDQAKLGDVYPALPLDAVAADIEDVGFAGFAKFINTTPRYKFTRDIGTVAWLATYSQDLARRDNRWGHYIMARFFANGWGVDQDYAKARHHANRGVELGLEYAKNVLGYLAVNGFGEPKDEVHGFALIREAADAGELTAMYAMSFQYFNKEAVGDNVAQGLAWLKRAAEAGHQDAIVKLGHRYLYGEAVDQDAARALELFEKAREHRDSQAFRGLMYEIGEGVEADQKKASRHYLDAAEQGQLWAQLQIGERLIAGTGVAADRATGIDWLRRAADAGHEKAKAALAAHGIASVDLSSLTRGSECSIWRDGKVVGRVSYASDVARRQLEVIGSQARYRIPDLYIDGELVREGPGKSLEFDLVWKLHDADLEIQSPDGETKGTCHIIQIVCKREAKCIKRFAWAGGAATPQREEAMPFPEDVAANVRKALMKIRERATIDGVLAHGAGDFETARKHFEQACEDGDAIGCIDLALMAKKGEGGPKDLARAREFYDRACTKGGFNACSDLGIMLYNGDGGAQDMVRARALYDQACDGEFAAGCLNAGIMVHNGEGGAQDKARARTLYDQACKGGIADGCYNAGLMRAKGVGGAQDVVRAREQYDQACEGGDAEGCYNAGVMRAKGEGGAQDMVRARELYDQACERGYADGCYNAGLMFAKGEGGAQDMVRARELYGQACERGNVKGCYNAGVMFSNGEGGTRDKARARALYDQACEGGDANGCYNAGLMFANGEGGAQDMVRARELYDQACKGGNVYGCFNASLMFNNGEGGAQDKARARTLYDQACEGGFARGCYNAGLMLANGEGGAQDMVRARTLYDQACKGGFARGCYNAGNMFRKGKGGAQNLARAQALLDQACKGGFPKGCSTADPSAIILEDEEASTLVFNTPIYITDDDFDSVVNRGGLVLVIFWAPWCDHCNDIAPVLEGLAADYGDALTVAKINVDDNQQKTAEFGVRAIPTLVLFKNAEPVETLIGVQTRSSLIAAIDRARG